MKESDNENKVDPNQVYNYVKAIFNYEKEVEKISTNYTWNETHFGYIIKLKDYEQLKNKVKCDDLKKYINDENLCKQEINKLIESNEINDHLLTGFDRLRDIDREDFIDSLKNKEVYKLINKDLWDVIYRQEKSSLMYLVDYPEMTIYLSKKNEKDIIPFSCINNNILNQDSLISFGGDKIMNIAKSIIEFHKFEAEIESNLKDKKEDIKKCSGYFISKNWVDNWKNYIDYDRINFKEKENDLIYKIMKQVFAFLKKNKGKKMLEMEVLNFKSPDKFEKYLEKGSLVLINEVFYYLVNKKPIEVKHEIHFTASDRIINVYLKDGKIKIASYGNLILSNNIKKYEYFIKSKENLKMIHIKEPIFENEDEDEKSLWSSFTFIAKKNNKEKSKKNNNKVNDSNNKLNNINNEDNNNIINNTENNNIINDAENNNIINNEDNNNNINNAYNKNNIDNEDNKNNINHDDNNNIIHNENNKNINHDDDNKNNIDNEDNKNNINHDDNNTNINNDDNKNNINNEDNKNNINHDDNNNINHDDNNNINHDDNNNNINHDDNNNNINNDDNNNINHDDNNNNINHDDNNNNINHNDNNNSINNVNNNDKADNQINNEEIDGKNIINNDNQNINNHKGKTLENIFKLGVPHRGLTNIGATCYMNSSLQCFCHIKKLVQFFKYSQQANNINDNNTLSSSFKLLIENLWPEDYNFNSSFSPYEFKDKISKMNNLFEGIAANDAKDLVNFIILTLHQELNKKVANNNANNDEFIDQRNQYMVFNAFVKDFMDNNHSIISDLFYSMNCSISQCHNCNTRIYNYQTYFFVCFPLEEIRKYKNEKYNCQINNYQFNNYQVNNYPVNNENEVNIYDCFDYDCKINLMDGDKSMYCNYCKQNMTFSLATHLVTGSEILILILNRGKGIEFNVKINFTEELNLYNYIEYKNTGYQYRLLGVITHIGESSMNGHFIAYCRDPINLKWYKYNDAIVNEVNDFQNEVINFAMPYLLFYQKIDV